MAGDSSWTSVPLVTKNLLFVGTASATDAIDLGSHKVVCGYPAAGKLALASGGALYCQNGGAPVAINVK